MFRQSVTEESPIYRSFWHFFNSTIIFFSAFGTFLYFQLVTGKIETDVFILFAVGVVIQFTISLSNLSYSLVFANLAPLLMTLFAIVTTNQPLDGLEQFLIIFSVYSVVSSVGNELLLAPNSITRTITFILLQANKIVAIGTVLITINNLFQGKYLFNLLAFDNLRYQNSFASTYLIINIVLLALSFFIILIQLVVRTAQLDYLILTLKQLTSWSLDKHIIEESLTTGASTVTHERRTVVIGDIRGFSNFSEKNSIKDVVTILEDIYVIIEDIIEEYGGFKPEFIADEFLTFFDDNLTAIKCSLEINHHINKYLGKYGLGMGIGIERGNVMEGVIGIGNSKKYTVIGATVNVAARLQGQAKAGEILATGRVLKSLDYIEKELVTGVKLKGVDRTITIYKIKDIVELKQKEKLLSSLSKKITGVKLIRRKKK